MSKKKSKKDKMNEKLDQKFRDILGETEKFGNETIVQKNVAEADNDYLKLFGANKNIARITPSLLDGLRPGKRRLFYSWWVNYNKPTNTKPETMRRVTMRKVNKILGDAMEYHPHGEMKDTIDIEGQSWNNNVMTIVPGGGYGNQHGEKAAAGRYIEAKLSEYTIDCFFDNFDKYPLDMVTAYTGNSEEPMLLPAKYPHILFNPQFSGIGWGIASNIPPYNVTEVLDATITLIKDPKAKIMLYPDIPNGCDVVDNGTLKDIMKTGVGKITMRATAEIDYERNVIKLTSLPIKISSDSVTKKIIERIVTGKIKSIVDVNDYSKEDINIDLILAKDAKPEKVLKKLYKTNVGLTDTKPVGIKVIDDFKVYSYGVRELLREWINYRIDMVRSMLLNEYQLNISREHMVQILLRVFNKNNIDKTINIAKTSKSKQETVERLMKEFNITSVQAGAIADMKVYNFNEDSYHKYQEEEERLKERIQEISDALASDENIEKYIIRELEEGKKKWGHPRHSKIVKEGKSNVPDTEHLVAVSENGYIKKIDLKKAATTGVIGKSNALTYAFAINNRESLLVIDSTGNIIKIPVSKIPDSTQEDIGYDLKRFCTLKGDVKTVMDITEDEIKNSGEYYSILIVTKNGVAKRTKLSEFEKLKDYMSCITLNDGDEVASATFIYNDLKRDIILNTNKGNGIRLHVSDVKLIGKDGKGVSIVSLDKDEEILSTSVISGSKKMLFYITTSGRAKTTLMKNFPVMNKKDKTINLISLQGDEQLLEVSEVNKSDTITVYRKKSEPETIEISSLEPVPRIASGTKLIKTMRGDMVTGYKIK